MDSWKKQIEQVHVLWKHATSNSSNFSNYLLPFFSSYAKEIQVRVSESLPR